MSKLSVVDAAEALGVTKEAVYNRIRRGTLESVTEEGVKYVILTPEQEASAKKSTPSPAKRRTKGQTDDRFVELLLGQIDELKETNTKLENDKERLISEKEELLINSKEEIERIYKERDKQIKTILALITKPLLARPHSGKETTIDADFEELTPYERDMVIPPETDKWRDVDEYMESKGFSKKKKKTINDALVAQVGFNKYIKEENGTLFIKRGKKIKEILGKK